jgi:hypothetical protein
MILCRLWICGRGVDAGDGKRSGELFSYVDLEQRVRADHPLRAIREMANAALDALSGDFSALYAPVAGHRSRRRCCCGRCCCRRSTRSARNAN